MKLTLLRGAARRAARVRYPVSGVRGPLWLEQREAFHMGAEDAAEGMRFVEDAAFARYPSGSPNGGVKRLAYAMGAQWAQERAQRGGRLGR